jgi:hypothetical protein
MYRIRVNSKFAATVLGVSLAAGLAGCVEPGPPTSQQIENNTRQSSYERLVANQPAHEMSYSPTRATKNFWIDTWDEPGKLSYVYLMNSLGEVFGYYIFEGLPVSYCTGLIPPYQLINAYRSGGGHDAIPVQGPSVDGTYASSSNCSTMYGKDATTGAYIEYTVGMGINALVYSEPMPLQAEDALRPLGWTTLDDVD